MAGNGRLEERGKNSWRLIAYQGYGSDGKQKAVKRSFKGTKKEAQRALSAFVLEVEKGLHQAPGKLTLADFIEQWRQNYANANLGPKTLQRYDELLNGRILPNLGHLRIEKITALNIMDFYRLLGQEKNKKTGEPLSPTTIKHYHRCLSAIMQRAFLWQIVSDNPCRRVEVPKAAKSKVKCYDEDQVMSMLEALEGEPANLQTLVSVAVFTGLRRGEIAGLKWSDIDINERFLKVLRTRQYIPGKGVIEKLPKNEHSIRALSIPDIVIDALRQHRKAQLEARLKAGVEWEEGDWVFTNWNGRPNHPDSFTKWFPEFLARHGLEHINFHALRHTAATMLINENVPLKNISGRLGHANVGTTGDIYSHYLMSADKLIAAKIDEKFKVKKQQAKSN